MTASSSALLFGYALWGRREGGLRGGPARAGRRDAAARMGGRATRGARAGGRRSGPPRRAQRGGSDLARSALRRGARRSMATTRQAHPRARDPRDRSRWPCPHSSRHGSSSTTPTRSLAGRTTSATCSAPSARGSWPASGRVPTSASSPSRAAPRSFSSASRSQPAPRSGPRATADSAWRLLAFLVTAVFGAFVFQVSSGPWIEAKALATASPAVLALALVGGAALVESGRRVEGHTRARRARRRRRVVERARLGRRAPGAARPARGARGDRGAVRGRRPGPDDGVPALRGQALPAPARTPKAPRSSGAGPCRSATAGCSGKGETAPIDAFRPEALLVYRTLVLLRAGQGGIPPSPFTTRRARALLRRVAAAGLSVDTRSQLRHHHRNRRLTTGRSVTPSRW